MKKITVASVLVCLSAAAYADLAVAPDRLIFYNHFDKKTLNLGANEKPLSAEAVSSVQFFADNDDWTSRFVVTRDEGRIEVSPAPDLQPGVYRLVIKTSAGDATIPVFAPLQTLPTSFQEQADVLGVTVQQLTAELGGVDQAKTLELVLPAVVYSGQQINVPMQTPPERHYQWLVNGVSVANGIGPHTFSYAFNAPGLYGVSYVEREANATSAFGTTTVLVMTQAGRGKTLLVGEPLVLSAPANYAAYEWRVDNVVQSTQLGLKWTFAEPGEHVVTLAAVPATPNAPPLEQAWRIVVERPAVIPAAAPQVAAPVTAAPELPRQPSAPTVTPPQ